MLNAFQRLGDRIIGRLVPEVTAEAGVQDRTEDCGCFWDSPGYVRKHRSCVSGAGCGACYVVGAC